LTFHGYFSFIGFFPACPSQCPSEKGKKVPGEKLPALTPVPDAGEFGKNPDSLSRQFAAIRNRRFKFQERRQPFHPRAQ
jgi:hypothetical protein